MAVAVESERREGLDLEFISEQWGHANVAFANLVGRYGSVLKAAEDVVDGIGADFSLEGFQRSTHEALFNYPDNPTFRDVSIIATSLLACAQASRVIESLTPKKPQVEDRREFSGELIKSLFMVDRAVAELKGFSQSGPLSELTSADVRHGIYSYLTK